jgi:hypothetical protein
MLFSAALQLLKIETALFAAPSSKTLDALLLVPAQLPFM